MSKKKHPEHVNHERWLVSYADFITLLFAFFVVLFASGQSDKKKVNRMQIAMQTAFEHTGIFDPHSKIPPLSQDAVAASEATPAPMTMPLPVRPFGESGTETFEEAQQHAEHEAAAHIKQAMAREEQQKQLSASAVSLRPSPEGLVVSLREAGFFSSGSAEIRPESLDTLRALAEALPREAMRVEGHTDNLPIHTAQFATNWELSTARASAITRVLLQQHATSPDEISAAGYAEFHPRATNATESGRAENRRVDIVLLRPVSPPHVLPQDYYPAQRPKGMPAQSQVTPPAEAAQ
jgi:chemotaxis protein MotB